MFALLVVSTSKASAQDPPSAGDTQVLVVERDGGVLPEDGPRGPRNTLSLNPLSLIFGVLSLEYERALSEHLSVYVSPSVYLAYGALESEFETTGYGSGGGVRAFPVGAAPSGFYLAVGGEGAYAEAKGASGSARGFGYEVGAQLGYTWLIADVIDISLGAGVKYADLRVDTNDGRTYGDQGVLPSLRLAMGMAFQTDEHGRRLNRESRRPGQEMRAGCRSSSARTPGPQPLG